MSTNDSLPDDVETLRQLVLARDAELAQARAEAAQARAEASSVEALVVHLRLTIEKLKRDLFGPRNERKARLIDQMELELEELEAAATEDEVAAEKAAASTQVHAFTRRRPARKRPLYELIRAHVFAGDRVHGDETTVPVLAKHQTRKGRLWAYVRDDQPFAGRAPPAAVFFYSRDRTAQHPERHLRDYAGILQADAYAGFNRLYEAGRKPGPITEASCWAHGRRKFFELADVTAKARGELAVIAPLAFEAVKRIDAIFDIEREINGQSIDERLAVRRERVAPLVSDLEAWMQAQRAKLSRHNDVAKAMNYMLTRWDTFTRFLNNGRICLTNNAAERALRGIAMTDSLCTSSSSICKH
jgi:hypothetical protein